MFPSLAGLLASVDETTWEEAMRGLDGSSQEERRRAYREMRSLHDMLGASMALMEGRTSERERERERDATNSTERIHGVLVKKKLTQGFGLPKSAQRRYVEWLPGPDAGLYYYRGPGDELLGVVPQAGIEAVSLLSSSTFLVTLDVGVQ